MSESNDRKIEDATPDTDITGVEKIPVSDNGAPKCVTAAQMAEFTVDSIKNVQTGDPSLTGDFFVATGVGGQMKRVSAEAVATAVINYLFDRDFESDVSTNGMIIYKDGDEYVRTNIDTVANLVKALVEEDRINIDALSEAAGVSDGDMFAFAEADGDHVSKKVDAENIVAYILSKMPTAITESTAAIVDADYIICIDQTTGALKKVKKENAGLGTGDVTGPSANTDGKIPVWDGTNTKKLKDGYSVTDEITSGSSSTEIPTAAAVAGYMAGQSSSLGDVKGPSSSTDGDIARFDGTTGKVIKGGTAVTTTVSMTATDAKVPTEKAVEERIQSDITSSVGVGGTIRAAISSFIDAAVAAGGAIAGAISSAITSAIGTGGAIKEAIDDAVDAQYEDGGRIDERVDDRIDDSLGDGGAIKGAIGEATQNLMPFPIADIGHAVPLLEYGPDGESTVAGALKVESSIDDPVYTGESVPTTGAVKSAIESVMEAASGAQATADGCVKKPLTNTDGRIPQWDGANTGKLKNGLTLQTSGTLSGSTSIPSSGAVAAAIANAITASLESGGNITQAITAGITAALGTTGAITQAIGSKIATELGPNGAIGSRLEGVVVDEGQRTNDMAAVLGVRYITDPTTGDQVPRYGRYNKKFVSSSTASSETSTDKVPVALDASGLHLLYKYSVPSGLIPDDDYGSVDELSTTVRSYLFAKRESKRVESKVYMVHETLLPAATSLNEGAVYFTFNHGVSGSNPRLNISFNSRWYRVSLTQA